MLGLANLSHGVRIHAKQQTQYAGRAILEQTCQATLLSASDICQRTVLVIACMQDRLQV
jgi:hypothetical protein